MADTYEQNLGQKSLVTADDYVRVVGTDNVSYKQQISSTPSHFKVISGTDLLGYIKSVGTGTYFIRMDNVSGLPSGGVVYRIVKTHGINDARCSIIAIPMGANASIYTTFITSASASSISWTAQPTRAEIDALNSNIGACSIKRFSNPGSGGTAEVPLSATGIIFVLSVLRATNIDENREGYGLIKYYNDNAYLTRVVGLSGFSVTMSNNNAVITMAPYTNVMLICISR